MKTKYLIAGSALVLCILAGQSDLDAVKYITQKSFIKKNLPAECKMSKSTITLPAETVALLKEKSKWLGDISQIVFITGRDEAGNIAGAVYFATVYVTEHKCVHHLAVALEADGSVKQVAVTELFCERAMPVTAQSFLGQFKKKPAEMLELNEGIAAVTGATESCLAIVGVVNSAICGYTQLVKK